MTATQKVRTCLCDTEAEEAANFYISLIPNSRILDVARYGEAADALHQARRVPVDVVVDHPRGVLQEGPDITASASGPDYRALNNPVNA